MKPFNLEAALAGAPVVTRDGIVVEDMHYFSGSRAAYPLHALCDGCILTFTREGKFTTNRDHNNDLFMAPTKKQGWVNLYTLAGYDSKAIAAAEFVWPTEGMAQSAAGSSVLATVFVEWEE